MYFAWIERLAVVGAIAVGVIASGALSSKAQPFGSGLSGRNVTPFPAQAAKDITWYDSLAAGIQAAKRLDKPICLILAGQRPSGDC